MFQAFLKTNLRLAATAPGTKVEPVDWANFKHSGFDVVDWAPRAVHRDGGASARFSDRIHQPLQPPNGPAGAGAPDDPVTKPLQNATHRIPHLRLQTRHDRQPLSGLRPHQNQLISMPVGKHFGGAIL